MPLRRITIIEFAVVLAVVAVVSAVAFPRYQAYRYMKIRAELPVVVDGIRRGQIAHRMAKDSYVNQIELVPDGYPADEARAWPRGTGFEVLGYEPAGPVFGSYNTEDLSADFGVNGFTNADSDDAPAHVTASQDVEPMLVSPPEVF